MLQMGKIGFLGGGKIAQAMVKGFLAAGLTSVENVMASVHPADTASFESFKSLGATTLVENAPVVKESDVIFVSVKPGIVPKVLQEIKPLSNDKLFISVAMGVTIHTLEKNLSERSRVIRAMPNTPVLVRKGCSVFARGKNSTEKDAKITKTLLEAVGTCEEVTESFLDPITGLSGSGPAYVFVLIESLADGAVRMGLPRDLSYRLASQTVLGSGEMVKQTKTHPGQLKDEVTSPAGSTADGLNYLELTGFRASVSGAVEAATERCKKIAKLDE